MFRYFWNLHLFKNVVENCIGQRQNHILWVMIASLFKLEKHGPTIFFGSNFQQSLQTLPVCLQTLLVWFHKKFPQNDGEDLPDARPLGPWSGSSSVQHVALRSRGQLEPQGLDCAEARWEGTSSGAKEIDGGAWHRDARSSSGGSPYRPEQIRNFSKRGERFGQPPASALCQVVPSSQCQRFGCGFLWRARDVRGGERNVHSRASQESHQEWSRWSRRTLFASLDRKLVLQFRCTTVDDRDVRCTTVDCGCSPSRGNGWPTTSLWPFGWGGLEALLEALVPWWMWRIGPRHPR